MRTDWASSYRRTYPVSKPTSMTHEFDFLKIPPSSFEILRVSMFDELFATGPNIPALEQPIHFFKIAFSSVALAPSGFFIDKRVEIRSSDFPEFSMSSADAFVPWDLYGSPELPRQCRKEWRKMFTALLCDEPRLSGSNAYVSLCNPSVSSNVTRVDTRFAERTESIHELVERRLYSDELISVSNLKQELSASLNRRYFSNN